MGIEETVATSPTPPPVWARFGIAFGGYWATLLLGAFIDLCIDPSRADLLPFLMLGPLAQGLSLITSPLAWLAVFAWGWGIAYLVSGRRCDLWFFLLLNAFGSARVLGSF